MEVVEQGVSRKLGMAGVRRCPLCLTQGRPSRERISLVLGWTLSLHNGIFALSSAAEVR